MPKKSVGLLQFIRENKNIKKVKGTLTKKQFDSFLRESFNKKCDAQIYAERQKILDVCCGGKMFWFDKKNPNVLFLDIRKEKHKLCDGRKFEVNPDIIMDFRNLKFENKTFQLVVFDPPHLKRLGPTSWMAKKYGVLNENWEDDLKQGFDECWRVLKNNGVLIFKWNERDTTIGKILKIFGREPLFGHTTGSSGKTKWMCFMKLNNK